MLEDSVEYVYDPYGKLLEVKQPYNDSIGLYNPLIYKDYIYDFDTELYYLQSRYYDPEVGRFLNADKYVSTGRSIIGFNVFAYCSNNPIIYKDESGCREILSGSLQKETDYERDLSFAKEQENRGLPKTGEPNSKQTLYNPDGTLKQEREYGPDGQPTKDTDYNHGGNHQFPHEHEWDENGVRGKATPIPENGSSIKTDEILTGIGTVGTGYVLYRIVRMIPSLLPWFWGTIPANIAAP